MTALNLSDLIHDLPAQGPEGLSAAVAGIAYRSDLVRDGDAFFCVRGLAHDGHSFAADAAGRGASVIVVTDELAGLPVPQVRVEDTRVALALASSRLFGEPSRRMAVVGITGTNGKTTTTYLLDAIARAHGSTTGIVGTVEIRVADERRASKRTTPESRDLQELLANMADSGVEIVAMEVSSHAIDLHRVDAIRFAVAAFTNLSQDHLDYHGTLEEYFSVKSRLFDGMDVGSRVVNIDDTYGRRLAEQAGAEITVGFSEHAMVRAESVAYGPTSTSLTLVAPSGRVGVSLPLAGAFNVSNALVAAGCALGLGIPLSTIAAGLEGAQQVPGRLERIDCGQDYAVLVDYAHTPDGLEKAIAAVREVTPGRVITVFGCGGDRDPSKRPLMGEVAGRLSDIVVVTSDNPRTEDPLGIILQIEDGLHGAVAERHAEVDRRRAIALALSLAHTGDAVLLAGKGHEDYQIFADGAVHFDDREVAREELARGC
ncbi:MAG: UDP-N-acetylmuramoyl-L-alanyl-D-glutamate--2,6-diaminopimelate ligase [Coriobacteriia bacterium]|nr:UDP-N-acetylmuramoyl-L-alanyl-D-glutamate--2,6-diaminopimelate ligase [Coriobacteriia bacterium]